MKNSIDKVFQTLKKYRKKAIIAYLAAGYPKFSEQNKLIQSLQENGVHILELGIPFSDPVADGPTIQFASQASLKNGTNLKQIFDWIQSIKADISMPVVLMSYLNPILNYGLNNFAKSAMKVGVAGLIVPDLIPEESGGLKHALARHGIHLIYLVAPTTPLSRQRMIASKTSGFLYAVSVRGVTGARSKLPSGTKKWIRKLKSLSPSPVCVGFGISGPKQIQELKSAADGFIVGSALIDIIRKNKPTGRPAILGRFARQLVQAGI